MPILRSNRGFLICLTGIEGSGKTTHAKSLVKTLSRKGYSCVYVWGASKPLSAYVFLAVTRALGFWHEVEESKFVDPLEHAPKDIRDGLISLWRILLFLDFQIKILLTIRLYLLFGKIVICDRYFFDLAVELMLHKQYSDRFGKWMLRTTPMPHITFLLDIPETLASKRRNLACNVFSDRRREYLQLAQRFDIFVLNTSIDFQTNFKTIFDRTLDLLRANYESS